ncbi:MAG TPA: multiheme c-type cytochrome [Armatimonadota bacterium]
MNDLQVSTLWDAYTRMKFDAATLCSSDLPDLDRLPPAARPILVSANVTYQGGPKDGKPIAPPILYKRLKTSEGKTVVVAIIGLLGDDPYLALPSPANSPTDKPWKVSSPDEALKQLVPTARRKATVVVVMFAGQRESGRKLLEANPGVDVMVVGLEGALEHNMLPVGKSMLVQNADRGRYAGQLGITLDKDLKPASYDLRNYTMDATFADDPAMAAMVKDFHEKQTKIVPPMVAAQPSVPVKKSDWAGSYMCASCHSVEFNQWKTTKHFAAMVTLEQKDGGQAAKRADCVGCHVVANDKPGGYSVAMPRWDLKGVGCEACHGPAAAHVDARLRQLADPSKMIANPGQTVCVTCHTKDNSPAFDFATYHQKIVHKPAAAPTAPTAP